MWQVLKNNWDNKVSKKGSDLTSFTMDDNIEWNNCGLEIKNL